MARDIVETQKYQNFEMLYVDYDIEIAIAIHESRGGEGWQLIGLLEPQWAGFSEFEIFRADFRV